MKWLGWVLAVIIAAVGFAMISSNKTALRKEQKRVDAITQADREQAEQRLEAIRKKNTKLEQTLAETTAKAAAMEAKVAAIEPDRSTIEESLYEVSAEPVHDDDEEPTPLTVASEIEARILKREKEINILRKAMATVKARE